MAVDSCIAYSRDGSTRHRECTDHWRRQLLSTLPHGASTGSGVRCVGGEGPDWPPRSLSHEIHPFPRHPREKGRQQTTEYAQHSITHDLTVQLRRRSATRNTPEATQTHVKVLEFRLTEVGDCLEPTEYLDQEDRPSCTEECLRCTRGRLPVGLTNTPSRGWRPESTWL